MGTLSQVTDKRFRTKMKINHFSQSVVVLWNLLLRPTEEPKAVNIFQKKLSAIGGEEWQKMVLSRQSALIMWSRFERLNGQLLLLCVFF